MVAQLSNEKGDGKLYMNLDPNSGIKGINKGMQSNPYFGTNNTKVTWIYRFF